MTNKKRTDWPAQNSILRRTGGHAVRQETNIRTDRHTQKQTGRQTDREIEREAYAPTQIQRHTHRHLRETLTCSWRKKHEIYPFIKDENSV